MNIKLNFINQSNDTNNSQIVIFQKNVTTDASEVAVAWQVIQNCGLGDHHPFTYNESMQVSAGDSYGNFTAELDAQHGQAFQMEMTGSGHHLSMVGVATSPNEVQVLNNLPQGAISANVYRSGKLCASKSSVAPMQKAVFQFKPTIWIGAVSEVQEGEVMNSAIVSNINTEISLLGIASADIVMTGGGAGVSSTPFQFSLRNVKMV